MKIFGFATSLPLAVGFASALCSACGDGGSSRGAASDASVTDAEGEAADGSADLAVEASDAPFAVQATRLVDDMRGPAMQYGWLYPTDGPGTQGTWYAYSDRTVPWSFPPIFDSDAGVLVPSDGVVFPPTDDAAGPVYLGSVQPYRRCSGGGEVVWGIGFGMEFIDVAPDGGDLTVNDCDAGVVLDVRADAGASIRAPSVPMPFDASAWAGIQFWGKSLRGVTQPVQVFVDDDTSSPFGSPVDAGGCNACATSAGACGDGFQGSVDFPVDWTQFQVPFASLHPLGWSGASRTAVPNASKLFALHFQIGLEGKANAVVPFDVAVAYVELYR
jgi:hypothetical protein